MTDVFDLNAEREKRDGPDAEFIVRDSSGRKMYAFTVDFRHNDSEWSFQIFAYDMAEAKARVDSIRASATLAGQLYTRIPL